jgi:hypothetical protein
MRHAGHQDAAPDCDEEVSLAALPQLERPFGRFDPVDGPPRLHRRFNI